jgi:hypothetical protein
MRAHRSGAICRHVDLGIEVHADWDSAAEWYELSAVSIADQSKREPFDVAENLTDAVLQAREYLRELEDD